MQADPAQALLHRQAIQETRGRYVDRRSRRAGRWAIDHRIYLNDWMTFVPVPDEAVSAFTGRRDSDDVSYTAFAELQNGERNQ